MLLPSFGALRSTLTLVVSVLCCCFVPTVHSAATAQVEAPVEKTVTPPLSAQERRAAKAEAKRVEREARRARKAEALAAKKARRAEQRQLAKQAREERRAKVNEEHGVECRRVRETGSRTTKKVCTTAAQRKNRTQRSREDLQDYQRTRQNAPVGGVN